MLAEVRRELEDRYSSDYLVSCVASAAEARAALAGSETGRAVLASAGARRLPPIRMPDGTIMEDPTDAEIAVPRGRASTRTGTATTW